jgi:hypothetical protein
MTAKKLKNDKLSNRGRDLCEIRTRDEVHGIRAYLRIDTVLYMTLQTFVGPSQLFQFRNLLDYLDGGSARRKASTYTQDNTNTE